MSTISTRPLTIAQAESVLETLALLTADMHKNSKIVFYETRISLESDSSTWRTWSSWTSPLTTSVKYYAGYRTEAESRDIANLPTLIEKVHVSFLFYQEGETAEEYLHRQELAEKAVLGLEKLHQRYLNDRHKDLEIASAIQTAKKIKKMCDEKAEQEGAAKNEENLTLRQRIIELKALLYSDKDKQIEHLITQFVKPMELLRQQLEEKDKKIAQLEQRITEYQLLLAGEELNSVIAIQSFPTPNLLARMRAILEALESKKIRDSSYL